MKKSQWFCNECGFESSGYLGKCPACAAWNSFKRAPSNKSKNNKRSLFISPESKLMTLDKVTEDEITRLDTKSSELNRTLGTGIVPGSLILLGGEPGIGKSTLLLQVANAFTQQQLQTLYVSAEESSRQIKLRANRLKLNASSNSDILILAENSLSRIIDIIEEEEPQLVIIDSIQAVHLASIDSAPGSPSQIRECCGNLMRLAKSTNIPIFIVGHINKDGDLAGPKILEHMVDTVLQFEGSKDSNIRFLRTIKNRFGSTDEVGIFSMENHGLIDLNNPSEIFLDQKSDGIIFAAREGRRTILLELQALALGSDYHNPRRVANGIELSRLQQILAVLEKKTGLSLSASDIYLNVVGGMTIRDPAADLAIALAVFNSARNTNLNHDIIALGELGLAGEIRAITDIETRIKEAVKLGYQEIIIPKSNIRKLHSEISGAKIKAVANIEEAIRCIDQDQNQRPKLQLEQVMH